MISCVQKIDENGGFAKGVDFGVRESLDERKADVSMRCKIGYLYRYGDPAPRLTLYSPRVATVGMLGPETGLALLRQTRNIWRRFIKLERLGLDFACYTTNR